MPKQLLEEELEKISNSFKIEISTISVGKATPLLVEDIIVNYYGNKTPLKQIATISIPDIRNIIIQPWDKKQLKEIEKAINTARLGLNAVNDGDKIRITIPQPTEEKRKETVKHLYSMLEKAKISVRAARENAMKKIKKMEKDKLISEDDRFSKQEEIQKVIDKYNKKLEEKAEKKKNEIMTI